MIKINKCKTCGNIPQIKIYPNLTTAGFIKVIHCCDTETKMDTDVFVDILVDSGME